jgi:hypothetical protein
MAKRQITGVMFDIWFPDPYFLKRYVLHELIQKSERALTKRNLCRYFLVS